MTFEIFSAILNLKLKMDGNMYVPRTLEKAILRVTREFPALLLTGPRQVGKTTLFSHLLEPGRTYVTLDDLALRTLANEDPALFFQRFQPPIFIDEIQYAPKLLPYIKMEIDRRNAEPGLFWLTGSQQFLLMSCITESLAGRVAIINLLGFSMREEDQRKEPKDPFLPTKENILQREASGASFTLPEIFYRIWRGSFPALVTGKIKDRDLFYSSYVQTYLQRDVSDLAQVGNKEAFYRFLKACAARTAQILNVSDLARDADISVTTAKNWLSILEASFQVFLLRPYASNITKRLVKRPKLYFLDTGLAAYLTEWSSPETLASGAMAGAFFETFVLGEILKSWWHRLRWSTLFYFRNKDKKEIDFIFERDNILYPVEVKLGATPKKEWVRSFATLRRLGGEIGQGCVISLVNTVFPLDAQNMAIPVGII